MSILLSLKKCYHFTKTYLFSFTDRDKVTNRLKCEYVWKCEVVVPWIYAQVCGGTAWPDSLNFSGYVLLFCESLSECEHIFGITITVLKISQNNDNRGRHLEFYFHTGIGNWFQCFLVYPGLNLSSGSGSDFGSVSGSGSRFLLFHTPKMRWAIIQVSSQNVEYCSHVFPCGSIKVTHLDILVSMDKIFSHLTRYSFVFKESCSTLSCFWKVLIEKMIV